MPGLGEPAAIYMNEWDVMIGFVLSLVKILSAITVISQKKQHGNECNKNENFIFMNGFKNITLKSSSNSFRTARSLLRRSCSS